MSDLKQALLSLPGVFDAHVLDRTTTDGRARRVAYVVPAGSSSAAAIVRELATRSPGVRAPDDLVVLPGLPVDAAGRVDADQLARVPVVDAAVCHEWERQLASRPHIARVAVLPGVLQSDAGRLHLDDLLPQRARAADDEGGDAEPDGPPWARPGAMAIADGGPLPPREPDAPTVLGDALLRAARGDAGLITVDGAGHTRHESYAALAEHALRLLAILQDRGLAPGARVILQLRDPVLHFRAFWACVLGGVIPVTVAIPSDYDLQQAVVRKLVNVWHLLERPVVLTEAALADGVARVLGPGAPVMLVGETTPGPHGRVHRAQPTDVVFHQLTSGSTGTPKCIQETHAGIIAHIQSSALANGYHPGDVTLNWLPFDHVVPTLTVHLKDVYLGSRQIHVHPDRILAEPLRWLDMLQQHRVTRTWAPNFAFKMIADAVRRGGAGPWDLACVRTWMNAGEMVTLPALRDFLAALAASGVTPAAIQPAFGMAEACTCMTYNNAFDLDGSALRARVTRAGELRRCGDDPRAAVFIDLGPPTAGVAIRITDDHNTLLPEGHVGRFQIKGPVITPGYLLNDAANAEAFVGDGWFNTGDRGFILDGRLYLTGREKEVIIVRGANFYAYEIEDIVERVDGVAPTWAAACSWADPDSATEGLAIFFVARTAHDEAAVARRIRGQVAAAFGISPSIVLPVAQDEFPKTTSGKIQRTQLKARLRGEGLAAARRRSECLFGGEQSLPDWFFRPDWRPLAAHAAGRAPARLLVLSEETGRAAALSAALGDRTHVLQASPGAATDRDGYHQLLAELAPDAIAVLWPFEQPTAALHARLLPLLQALAGTPTRLLLVTRGALPVTPDDDVIPAHALARALARVAIDELPGLACRHLDLQSDDPAWAEHCATELVDAGHERVVAVRGGRRLVPRLARHRPRPRHDAPLIRGGAYLVSGGLGGIGLELVRHLATQWDARVLVLGRAPAVERAGALGELAALGAHITYVQADITDHPTVDAAVRAFEQRIGAPLSGVFHLAGVYQPRLIADESPHTFAAALQAKVDGAEVLAALLDTRPDCRFCAFSSINGHFGGLMVAAYTAANLALEALVARLRRAGRRAAALAWSIWDDLGMNAGNPTRDRLADLGYRAIAPADGLKSLLACLADDAPAVTLIGLDAGRAHVARELADAPLALPVVACFESQVDVFPLAALRALEVLDAFGTPAPASFRHLPALPLDAAAAVDRSALARALLGQRVAPAEQPATELQRRLRDIFREVLGVERVGVHDNFFDLGGSSLRMARVQARIKEVLGHDVGGVEMFRFPTVHALAERLAQAAAPARGARKGEPRRAHEPIAVVAMTCRFPMASSVDAYWDNLVAGRECIRRLDDAELRADGVSSEWLDDPRYVRAAGVLDDIDQFAASFFGCSAHEAESMDPQHRVFMELAWEALESAGYDPRNYPGAIGVFAGTTLNSYSLGHAPRPELDMAFFGDLVASDREFIATRLAYKLDLRGPAVNVQTACSTGLVAIHMACQSLLAGDADMALAGAASIRVPQRSGYLYQEGGIFSPDGHCRTFDEAASGTVFGNGAGVVLLKPLADAVRDGDTVLAVIRATAINNDGALKAGFTAPCQDGQIEVLRQALDRAGLRPGDIDYVEAHGTGTSMGDPIEVAALAEVFATDGARPGSCLLGSVKPSIGHLDAAAGMAGFIKTVLMLSRGRTVPTLHYRRPNPKLQLDRTPFRVATTSEPWTAAGRPLRAGVSAFGIGGTNAHAIVEQAPQAGASAAAPREQALILSAQSEAALKAMSHDLAAHLEQRPDLDLADVAYTLQVGRARFEHRRVVVAADRTHAAAQLRTDGPIDAALRATGAVFLFPGQGAQFPGMAADHYAHLPAFARELDALLALPETPPELRDLLLEPGGDPARAERFARTDLAQPGVFAVSLALARALRDAWGVAPVALAGHSLGEYVAATLAGVFTPQDAMRLIVARGRLMQAAPTGAMLSVSLPARALVDLLGDCEVAAVNAPEQTVVSGTEDAIAALESQLFARGVATRRLRTSHAYHSRLMDGVQAHLRAELADITLRPPTAPFVSCLTGAWISPTQATDPDYWVGQLRHPVLFADVARTLLTAGHAVFLEVGPGGHLTALMRRQAGFGREQRAWATAPHAVDRAPTTALLEALARLDGCGAGPDWSAVHGAPRRRVPLPTYPFERRRYWRDPAAHNAQSTAAPTGATRRPDPQDWFHRDVWRREPSRAPVRRRRAAQSLDPAPGQWLVFASGESYERDLLARLDAPYVVFPGPAFRRIDDTRFEVAPGSPADHAALLAALRDAPPDRIVHLWGLAARTGERALQDGLQATMHLIQALVAEGGESPVRIGVASAETEQVLGDERLVPEKVAVLGLCSSVTADYPRLGCFHADILRGELDGDGAWIDLLLRDMADPAVAGARAYRGSYCWTRGLAAFDPRRELAPRPRLRERGVYLVTGGLGGIGLAIAEWLGRTHHARLALVSRTALPPPEQWADVAQAEPHGRLGRALARLVALRDAGIDIVHYAADVTDRAAMAAVVADTTRRFGGLHGAIHAANASTHGAFRMIGQTDASDWARELAPKLHGTRVLGEVLPDDLDFCLVSGSVATVLGDRGGAVEAAANLAAAAVARNATTPYPWIVVDWERWAFHRHGLAEGSTGDVLFNLDLTMQGKFNMTPDEGLVAFQRALELAEPGRVVLSCADLDARLREQREAAAALHVPMPVGKKTTGQAAGARHERPALPTAYVEPADPLQRELCELWADILGLERVGVDDNFFDLGGDSLLFLKFAARLRSVHAAPVGQLFGTPTVGQIAALLRAAGVAQLAGEAPQPTAPAPAVQSIREHQFVVAPNADAQEKKAQMQRVYNAVTQQLDAREYASYAIFLNYGYKANHLPQRARIDLPERLLNRNCIKLVLELFGACPFGETTRFLDVGCGRGGTISVLNTYFGAGEVVGLDLSPEAVAFNRRTHTWPNTRFVQGDAERLPFADGAFDVVTNVESSHSYPDLRAFYSEAYRVLAPGGRFLYTDIFPTAMVAECVDFLCRLGFTLRDDRDITTNVVASCDEIGAAHFHAFADGNDAEALGNFLGAPGSKVYNDMQRGYSTYRIFEFVK